MRKAPALLVLLLVALFWSACGGSTTGNRSLNTNTTDKAEQIIREKQNANASGGRR